MENYKNEINLSIKDFQIIKKASLSFQPGLNAIIGQSNNGKTAIFRAAKSCIYNEPGTTSIRNGCSQYAVGIQMNGHTVICQKGKDALYKVDNMTYQKVGRTQLPEVAGALNIRELNLNGSNEQLNFWDQMEKPFLLDRSETELFRFIVDSGKDNNVTTALKTLTSDRQGITKEISMIEGMIAQAETNVKSFEERLSNSDNTLALCEKIIQLGPEIKRLENIKNKANELENIKTQLDKANEQLAAKEQVLLAVEDKSDKLASTIKLKDVITERVSTYDSRKNMYDTLNNRVNSINAIDVSWVNENYSKYKTIKEVISKYEEASGKFQKCSESKVPELSEDFTNMSNLYCNLKSIFSNLDKASAYKAQAEANIAQTQANIDTLKKELDEIGICPTCGQPIHS